MGLLFKLGADGNVKKKEMCASAEEFVPTVPTATIFINYVGVTVPQKVTISTRELVDGKKEWVDKEKVLTCEDITHCTLRVKEKPVEQDGNVLEGIHNVHCWDTFLGRVCVGKNALEEIDSLFPDGKVVALIMNRKVLPKDYILKENDFLTVVSYWTTFLE